MCGGSGQLELSELPRILLYEWIEGYDDDETDDEWLQEQLERLIRVRKKVKSDASSTLTARPSASGDLDAVINAPHSVFDDDDDLIDEDPPQDDDDWSGDGDGDGDDSGSGNGSGGGGDIDDDDDIYDTHPRFLDLYYT